jgi:hypothetical protein
MNRAAHSAAIPSITVLGRLFGMCRVRLYAGVRQTLMISAV